MEEIRALMDLKNNIRNMYGTSHCGFRAVYHGRLR